MKQLNSHSEPIIFLKRSYVIMGFYLIFSVLMGILCFFPLISELSYRDAHFLANQGKLKNFRYLSRFKYAFEEYEKAIRFFPLESHYASEYIKDLDTYINQTKNDKESIVYLNKAIRLMQYIQTIDTINPWYHARISALYLKLFQKTKDSSLIKQSSFHARQAVLSDYENPIFILNYANLLHRNKRYSEAFYYYQKAINTDDRLDDAYFNIANIYARFNQFHVSLNSYLKAKSLNPRFQYIDAVIIQTYMHIKEYQKVEAYINTYQLFYSKEDKTLDIISLFYLTQNQFLLSMSYLDLYLDLPQFVSKPPSDSIFKRYIACLSQSNQNHKLSSFITSQLEKYPNHPYLKSYQ